MKEIRYQPLPNNEDTTTTVVLEYNLNYNRLRSCLHGCKRHWLLIILLICFVFVKAIYVTNVFESHSVKDNGDYNQKDQIKFGNNSNPYHQPSEETFHNFRNETFKKQNDTLTTKAIEVSTTNSFYEHSSTTTNTTTTVAANNDIEFMTNIINFHGTTLKSAIRDNNYDNVDLATENTIDSKNDSKTITIDSNTYNINEIPIKKSATAIYINKSLSQTTETIIDPLTTNAALATVATPTATTTLTTKIINKMTTSLVKTTPAAKTSSPSGQRYFINTSQCHIPFVEPFTPDIRKMFKPKHYTGCTKDKPIVTSSFDEIKGQYILHINYTVAEGLKAASNKKSKPIAEDLLCCYKQIVRSGSGTNVDSSFKLLPCSNFHQDFVVPTHINGIIVYCKSKAKKSTLQEDAFSFVQVNKTLMQQQDARNIATKARKPSILMIGIDTLSRINFRRTMPETYKYLVENNWYELMGYNKVGDNTLPNLMPLLSGYTKKTVYTKCNPRKVGGFDDCNFIWSTFKSKGYHTAYAEDSCFMSTFNYQMKGFSKPPTDYYFRPMALAIEKSMKKQKKAGLNYCVGRKQFGEYIYDYATEFVARFRNQTNFGFFWTNSFSHNSYDVPATMDTRMVNYFKEWERLGTFENSVIMFFSDHGARFGPLLKLSQGFLEERLPMFFIHLPKWFHQEHPQLVRNLEVNQKRLTNSFDIHMTLQHLLKLAEPDYQLQQAFDCPKCKSIFEELPENRTCNEASIPEAWCTCLPFKVESTKNEVVQTVAKLVIQEINHYYERKNLTSLCSPLKLKEVTKAKSRYPDALNFSSNITTYAIDFATEPITKPITLFSANVDYDVQNKRIHLNVEDISRQSLYENTAKCTDEAETKKYCICKNCLE